jgi:hypothetical protein
MPARYAHASNKVFHSAGAAAHSSPHENDAYQGSLEDAEQTTANAEIRDQRNFFCKASSELGNRGVTNQLQAETNNKQQTANTRK